MDFFFKNESGHRQTNENGFATSAGDGFVEMSGEGIMRNVSHYLAGRKIVKLTLAVRTCTWFLPTWRRDLDYCWCKYAVHFAIKSKLYI
jgi:hypothetical protein